MFSFPVKLARFPVLRLSNRNLQLPTSQAFNFSATSRIMAAQPTQASEVISDTARAEGGPVKGSTSAQMQSQVGKTRNFEQAAQEVASKVSHVLEFYGSDIVVRIDRRR